MAEVGETAPRRSPVVPRLPLVGTGLWLVLTGVAVQVPVFQAVALVKGAETVGEVAVAAPHQLRPLGPPAPPRL